MINYTEKLDKAIRVAAWAHEQQGQHRKGSGLPYIVHPFGTMVIASNVTNDEDILIACLLHDILEDVDEKIYNKQKMNNDFGERVVSIVDGVTKDSSIKDWQGRADAYLLHLEKKASDESVVVSAADKIHNLLSIIDDYKLLGDELWSRFNAGKKQQLWWYRSILGVITKRNVPSKLSLELKNLILQLESLINGSPQGV
jgi:(p)ppGpp synthase/HD superfamily hydrolase